MRRFYAPTLPEALRTIKETFGQKAVILSTREVGPEEYRPWAAAGARAFEVVASDDTEMVQLPAAPEAPAPELPPVEPLPETPPDASSEALARQLRQIQGFLRQLAPQVASVSGRPLPPLGFQMHRHLVRQEFDPLFAQDTLEGVFLQGTPEQLGDPQYVREATRRELARYIPVCSMEQLADSEARALAVIGPTGVGKSTLIAKISTILRLATGQTVRVACLARKGEAPAPALQMACRLSGIELYSVENIEDIAEFLEALAPGGPRHLLDLGSFGPYVEADQPDLASFLATCQKIETLLAVSGGTKTSDLIGTIAWGRSYQAQALAVTKLDETATVGSVFEAIRATQMPVAAFCAGRRIPEDLTEARAEELPERATQTWQESM